MQLRLQLPDLVVIGIDMARRRITGESMAVAMNTFENNAVSRAIEADKLDRKMKAACNRMTANTKSGKVTRTGKLRHGRPHTRTRWLFNHVASGFAKPWAPLVEMMHDAMEHGAPEADVMAIVNELENEVRAFYIRRELMPQEVPAAICLEATTDAAQDVALAKAAVDPTRTNLEDLLEKSVAHERAEENLVDVVRGHLALAR